jgi:GTP-binding protein HflX
VQEAALILHVTDISDPRHAEHDAEVSKVLKDLGVEDRPRLYVLNKADRLSAAERKLFQGTNNHGRATVLVSAATGEGLPELLKKIDDEMPVDPVVRSKLRIPVSDGRHLSLVHGFGRVLHSELAGEYLVLEAEVPQSLLQRRLEPFVV